MLALKDAGLLTKNTHGDRIRFAPPLCINEQQVLHSVETIHSVVKQFAASMREDKVASK